MLISYRSTLEGGEEPECVVLPPRVRNVDDRLVVQPIERVRNQLVLEKRPQHGSRDGGVHPWGGGGGVRRVGGGELDASEGDLGGARGEPARVEHPLAHGCRRLSSRHRSPGQSLARDFGRGCRAANFGNPIGGAWGPGLGSGEGRECAAFLFVLAEGGKEGPGRHVLLRESAEATGTGGRARDRRCRVV